MLKMERGRPRGCGAGEREGHLARALQRGVVALARTDDAGDGLPHVSAHYVAYKCALLLARPVQSVFCLCG